MRRRGRWIRRWVTLTTREMVERAAARDSRVRLNWPYMQASPRQVARIEARQRARTRLPHIRTLYGRRRGHR